MGVGGVWGYCSTKYENSGTKGGHPRRDTLTAAYRGGVRAYCRRGRNKASNYTNGANITLSPNKKYKQTVACSSCPARHVSTSVGPHRLVSRWLRGMPTNCMPDVGGLSTLAHKHLRHLLLDCKRACAPRGIAKTFSHLYLARTL